MTQHQYAPAQSPYPGWVWDQPSGQWVPAPQAAVPAAPPVLAGPTIGMHLKRAIDWNVSDLAVSPRERAQLEAAGVVEPRMQALLAWRRSTMLVALPILVLGVVLSFVSAGKQATDGLSGLGTLVQWLPSLALLLIPFAALVVILGWTQLRRPNRTLIICWGLSIAIPLLAALLPIEALVDIGTPTSSDEVQQLHAVLQTGRVELAIGYALSLLPVIITIPSGVLKGAGRVKFLFPAAALPGWFLVAVAPFYSIFMIVVFVLIDQIIGNFLLVVAVGLLAFTPWLIVIRRRVYGRAMSIAEARAELPKAGRLGGYLTLAGFALIVIFLFTAKVEGMHVVGSDESSGVFTFLQVGRTALELFGRNLVTAVVFCMIFLSMVFAEWRAMQQMDPQTRAEHDMEMNALRRYAEAAQ